MPNETDNLLADVRAAASELAGDDPVIETPVVETPAEPILAETAQQTADRARDEAGRFAKAEERKARETLTLRADPAKTVGGLKADGTQVGPDGKPLAPKPLPPEIGKDGKHLDRIVPPVGWKGAAKVDWDRMPRNVREAVAAELNGVEEARNELAPLKELFDTNREFLVNHAGSVVEAQRQMMQFARMSVDNPVQLAEHILRSKGLDPRAVFSGQPNQAPAQGQPQNLEAFIAQAVEQRLQPIMAERAQAETQQTQATISQITAFQNDAAHPYFNDVAPTIHRFLAAGEIPPGTPMERLKEAYDRATWANPTIRATLIEAQREADGQRRAEEVKAARKAAAASLNGSPLPGVAPAAQNQHSSALDDVRAAARELAGA